MFRLFAFLLLIGLQAAPVYADRKCKRSAFLPFVVPKKGAFEVVVNYKVGENRVVSAMRYPKLIGKYAKVYQFLEINNGCIARSVSLGSYSYLKDSKSGNSSTPRSNG